MSRENSVLFSLRELRSIEDDRVRDERVAEVERRRREEEARRAAAEEARRREEEERRREEEERRRDQELAARRRELELESRLRVAETAMREAEVAAGEAMRREAEARAVVAPRRGGGLARGVLAACALVIVGQAVWIWRQESRPVMVVERTVFEPAVAPAPPAVTDDAPPSRTAPPEASPGVAAPQGPSKKKTKPDRPVTIDDPITKKCVCEDPRDPFCCLDP